MAQTKAQLLAGKSDQSVTFNDVTASSLNGGPFGGARNRIINGAMAISQRGTSFTNVGNSGSTPGYTLDRWCGWRGGYTANLDISQQSTAWGREKYCLRMQRTSGTSSTQAMVLSQVIESINIYDLPGQTATVSLGIRAGSNYSGGQVSVSVYFSTSADQSAYALSQGTWAGSTNSSQSFTISTTGTTYSFSFTVPANALSMAFQLNWTPTGTAGANDFIEITGVQLEAGSVATPFERRSYGQELALAQRYTYALPTPGGIQYFLAPGSFGSTTNGFAGFNFPQLMRATPSLSPAPTASNYQVYLPNSGTYQTLTAISLNGVSTPNFALINFNIASGGTAGQVCYLNSTSGNTTPIILSAEL